jgi:hypothetical protein
MSRRGQGQPFGGTGSRPFFGAGANDADQPRDLIIRRLP